MEFQAGLNVVLIELPGARLDALAGLQGLRPRMFAHETLGNRPLLAGKSGYELALVLHPVKPLGGLVYSTRLESTGAFSGHENDPRQDVLLTLFNPMKETSGAVTVRASVRGGGLPTEYVLAPVPPETQRRVRLSIPLGKAAPDETLRVHVELESAGESGTFEGEIVALDPVRDGTVYVITGTRRPGTELEDQSTRVERYLTHYRKQVALMEQEPAYGFDLGGVELWRAAFNLYPDLRATAEAGGAQSPTAAEPGVRPPAPLDSRRSRGVACPNYRPSRWGFLPGARLQHGAMAARGAHGPGQPARRLRA